MKKRVTVNKEQRLFVIPCGEGYTCLGFDVCRKRATQLAEELPAPLPKERIDSIKAYHEYRALCALAEKRHRETGWRSRAELTPWLIGLEGRHVEVITEEDEPVRFRVGKSTGWMPCHLQMDERRFVNGKWERDPDDDGIGGPAVCCGHPKSVHVIA